MTHLGDMAWFALLLSLALGVLSRRTILERVKYAAISFVGFLLIAVVIGWLMFPFSR